MVLLQERRPRLDPTSLFLTEKVVFTRRVAKVVAGGRHLRFNALVVTGDGQGVVGAGLGKANAIPDAVRKSAAIARKNLIRVPLRGSTIPHAVRTIYGSAEVLVKPAPAGTGIIASGTIRAVMEVAGIKDVVAKSLRSRNPVNVVRATLKALQQIKEPSEELAKRQEAPESRRVGEPWDS
ncbi:MAG: 30S ribosomal protein S5 [Dehalococcoidia bacterium]